MFVINIVETPVMMKMSRGVIAINMSVLVSRVNTIWDEGFSNFGSVLKKYMNSIVE
jgi:hypothetical protein